MAKNKSQKRLRRIFYYMHYRCNNERATGFFKYGGAGITVCKEWQEFDAFRDWALASGYADHLTIDRRKNDQGYNPENCRWSTVTEQVRNVRRQRRSTSPYKGVREEPSGRWRARIKFNKVHQCLGTFDTAEEAALAYDEAANRLFGEHACPNFPAVAAGFYKEPA